MAAGENPNYTVAVEGGTFSITPVPMIITLNGNSGTRVYNGESQTFEGAVTPSCESALFDASEFSYAGVTAVSGKDAGEYTEAIDIAKASYADPNIDAAFVAGEPIKLSIAKAALTVTADGASKIYGASDPELDYTVSGLQGGDAKGVLKGVTVTRAPGEGVGSYAITATGPESIKNYVVGYEGGSFRVVVAPFPANPDDSDSRFTVTEPEDVVYNGQPQKQPITLTDETTGDALVEGEDYELVYSDDITNAGTVTVTVKGIGSYEGSFDVSYEIAPAQLVVTTPDASKTYDGSALVSEGEITGFVNGETATFTTTGSQTNAGKSDNTYSLTWDGTAKESNYTLSEKIGTLEVAPRDVTLTSASASKAFDGTPLVRNAQDDVAVAGDGFVEGEGATYAITGTQTQVGESDNAFTYELTESTLAQNYNIDTVFGRLAVTEEAPEPPTPTPADHNPHLTVVKAITSQPANGDAYEEGEVIAYSVTVSNDGDVDLIDVVVSDQLKGFAWDEGVNPQIGSLAVNESVTLTGSYRVTKGDAEAGSVSNTARATGIFKESGGSNLEADPSGHEAPASSGKGDSGSGVSPSGTHTPGGPGAAAPSAPAPGASGATGATGATSTVSVVPAAGSSAPATSTSGTPAVATSGTGTSSLPTESVEALQDTGNPLVENAGGANPLDPNRGAGWVFGLLCAITAALLAIAALIGALGNVYLRRCRVDDAPAAEGAYIR